MKRYMKSMRSTSPQIKFDGAAVFLARKRAGLTQAGLARKMRVTHRTVQNWEQGLEPNAPNFLRLAKVLDLSPDDLYTMERAA